ncbi:beta-galactosidase, partial [Enterococcus mundtii]|uniref:beta-galactosidase n=3 Tax=Enterococcus TaxID=1350 RepID=UPI00036C29AA
MKTYNDTRLLHGGDYNPEQWLNHPEVLKKDFELMDKAHVNTVTVGIFSWSSLEPEEGVYHFDWLDKVFEEMHKRQGRVILATPSGGRPQWLSEKYPEVNRTNAKGQKHHHGFRHNHCYTSPIYREKVQQINRRLAERYGDHPALLLWHISNEYSGECYCPLCAAKWREWVKAKYQTLEAVNDAWWMTFWSNDYSSWSQVVPPSPLGEHKVHGMDLDWKRFVTDRTIDFFLHEIEPIRELTPAIPVTTNFMAEGHDQHDFIPLEGLDYSRFAEVVDIVSWDSYPDWHNPYESLHVTAMKSAYVHDQYRSLKKQPFLVMESTPSYVNWHAFNKAKKPGMHLLSGMQQLAHGSDSTLYFQWRQSLGNSEKFHGAVVEHDNSENNRVFQEVAAYGKRLDTLSSIKGTQTEAKVAILFDWESNWALKRGGGFGRPTRRYIQTLQEHYRFFWERDIAVDILTPNQDFTNYALVVAPMLYLMREETMVALSEYVKNGGTLIGSYFTGMVNEHDRLHLGEWPQVLQTLFGVLPKELDTLYPGEY